MRAASLLAIFLLAKVLILAGQPVSSSLWTPIAFLWQDVVVVLVFWALDGIVRRAWLGWGIYGLLVLYVALNVPLVRLLSSPLTVPMWRATSTTLGDSIRHHLTAGNLALMAFIILAGAGIPLWLSRTAVAATFRLRFFDQAEHATSLHNLKVAAAGGLALAVIALGPLATARIETNGLHRNFLFALVNSAVPRVSAHQANDDWRAGPFENSRAEDLTRYSGAAAGRNVVMIHLESAGARYLRPYGAKEDPTPMLTKLAEQAILFEHAYAVYPESIKGLFSVLCSRFPAFDTQPELYERITTPSIAAVLAKAGYRSALFHPGRFMYLGMESIIQNRGYQTLEDAGDIGGNRNSSFGVDEPAAVKRMLAWVEACPRGERFFITYLPIAGHHPYESPEVGPFPQGDELNQYRNALHYGDAALGEFITGLQTRGLFQNTLFIIFGDHGEAFGQHQGNYGHTLFIHEENVRVPYLVVAPGLLREQIRVQRVASLIDSVPTILDLLGLPVPPGWQGKSLLEPEPRLALFYTDYSLGWLGLRDGHWKFVHELEAGRSKLFDLAHDPDERNNLAGQFPDRVTAYRERLKRWSAAQRELVLRGE